MRAPVHLPPVAEHRRGHDAMYDAVYDAVNNGNMHVPHFSMMSATAVIC